MKVVALYGTESGNAEMIAEDIAGAISESAVQVEDMSEFDPDDLDPGALYLVICSSHGDGELPSGAQPFFDRLQAQRPDLTCLRYAMFGLGDRAYLDTYSQGSEHIDRLLTELGAVRVGEYGRHDASGFDDSSELGIAWAESVIAEVAAVV
ncbi:flavodoxin domain-containing protein [Microbacterium lacus]|uniref:flavodoxin domain-containing protein n=1 Tax=Microbacterium lacus TaxID=415217 RepID=UPI000C2C5D3F|nr:flavodoxin domain-containing protein [Microbacterium lacus]